MIEIAILDDLSSDRENLENIISEYFNIHNANGIAYTFKSANELLDSLPQHSFDLAFLDIKMAGITGMELAHIIRNTDTRLPIVFVTSAAEFALEGYEVQAADFIVKPLERNKIFAVLDRLLIKDKLLPYIQIKENREKKQILLDDILFAETRNHYVEIHTIKAIYRTYMTYDELRQLIPEQIRFQNCYRGIIVNLDRVTKFDNSSFILETGEHVPIARSKKLEIQNTYASYAFEKTRKGGSYEH